MSAALPGSASHKTPTAAAKSAPAAIEVAAFTKRYPAAAKPALEDFTLLIEPGTVRALLGTNGAGRPP